MKKSFGQIAYEAYCFSVGGKSVSGDPLPSWARMRKIKPTVTAGWIKAAQAVLDARQRSDSEDRRS